MTSSPKPVADDRGRRGYLTAVLLLTLGFVVMNAAHGDWGPITAGLGAGLGALLALQVSMLWVALFGRFSGFAVTGLELGYGRRLVSTRIGSLPVTVRRVPFPFATVCWTLVRRPGLRGRLVVSALLQTATQLGIGLWLLASGPAWATVPAGMFLLFALIALVTFKVPLTIGWVLFRMPFLPAEALTTYAVRPGEEQAVRALRDGRIADARAALERVADDGTAGFQTRVLRAGVDLAEGRYAESAVELNQALESKPHPRHAAVAVALRTASLVGAAETGQLPPAQYLPWLAQAVGLLRTSSPVLLRHLPAAADLALLEGRREEAVKLAGRTAQGLVDRFWEAHAHCTHAAALASVGRPEEGRAALERARRAMPGLARIALVEHLLGLNATEGEGEPGAEAGAGAGAEAGGSATS